MRVSAMSNSTVDWSSLAEAFLSTALGAIPEVGPLLSNLLGVFWPKPSEDVWGEIRDQVQTLINQDISDLVWNNTKNVLGGPDFGPGTGLYGDVVSYNASINTTLEQQAWVTTNENFIENIETFMQDPYEYLLLPLFAQMANLHLTVLRGGAARQYPNAEASLESWTAAYVRYADQWSRWAVGNQSAKYAGNFNQVNKVERFMQVNVRNFMRLWPCFSAALFPQPVKQITSGSEIFYSVTEAVNAANPGYVDPDTYSRGYSVPGTLKGYATKFDTYTLHTLSDYDL